MLLAIRLASSRVSALATAASALVSRPLNIGKSLSVGVYDLEARCLEPQCSMVEESVSWPGAGQRLTQ